MRISDWSSDVCSSDLADSGGQRDVELPGVAIGAIVLVENRAAEGFGIETFGAGVIGGDDRDVVDAEKLHAGQVHRTATRTFAIARPPAASVIQSICLPRFASPRPISANAATATENTSFTASFVVDRKSTRLNSSH